MRPSTTFITAFLILSISICKAQFQEDDLFSPSALFSISVNGKDGYLGLDGKMKIAPRYEEGRAFSEGLAAVRMNGKFGYIDTTGKMVIAPQFISGGLFSEGLARVDLNGVIHFIDKAGKIVINTKRKEIDVRGGFREGYCGITLDNDLAVFIDKTGKNVFGKKFIWVGDFSEGLAPVSFGEGFSIYETGTLKKSSSFPDNFDGELPPGHMRVWTGRKNGYIDLKGNIVISGEFQNPGNFSEGLAPVKVNGKYGYIDKTGKMVIDAQFILASSFREAIARVTGEGGYGFIDHTGKIIIPLSFSYTGSFYQGLAVAEKNGKRGYIDKKGLFIIENKFDRAFNFQAGAALIAVGNKYNYINRNGVILWK